MRRNLADWRSSLRRIAGRWHTVVGGLDSRRGADPFVSRVVVLGAAPSVVAQTEFPKPRRVPRRRSLGRSLLRHRRFLASVVVVPPFRSHAEGANTAIQPRGGGGATPLCGSAPSERSRARGSPVTVERTLTRKRYTRSHWPVASRWASNPPSAARKNPPVEHRGSPRRRRTYANLLWHNRPRSAHAASGVLATWAASLDGLRRGLARGREGQPKWAISPPPIWCSSAWC